MRRGRYCGRPRQAVDFNGYVVSRRPDEISFRQADGNTATASQTVLCDLPRACGTGFLRRRVPGHETNFVLSDTGDETVRAAGLKSHRAAALETLALVLPTFGAGRTGSAGALSATICAMRAVTSLMSIA